MFGTSYILQSKWNLINCYFSISKKNISFGCLQQGEKKIFTFYMRREHIFRVNLSFRNTVPVRHKFYMSWMFLIRMLFIFKPANDPMKIIFTDKMFQVFWNKFHILSCHLSFSTLTLYTLLFYQNQILIWT